MSISIAQIVVSVAIIVLILLQQRGAGMSGFLGAEGSGGYYQARRGLESVLFWMTIVLSVLFVALAAFQFIVK